MQFTQKKGILCLVLALVFLVAGELASTKRIAPAGTSRVLTVGVGKLYARPSQAAAAVLDGDTVEIDAGIYTGDVAVWQANNLTIRGVGGKAHLAANGTNAQGKAIWVIAGSNTTIQDIEFSGATVPDQNGAGIRLEGSGLTVSNCYFHDDEEGILTGSSSVGDVIIEYSEFARNGYGDGYSHNMYIGNQRSFTLRYCYVHHAKIGHNVKSRAQTNTILYNRIMDEQDGTSSYAIDLPNGGASYVIGNLIQQGPKTQNPSIVSYAAEGASNTVQQLFVVNNTIVNDYPNGGTFVQVSGNPTVRLINNIFSGPGNVGAGQQTSNMVNTNPMFVDKTNYDYHLASGSPAIDAGANPGSANGVDLIPVWQYVHPANRRSRSIVGSRIDIGSYEFGSSQTAGCDLNNDSSTNVLDIQILVNAILAGNTSPTFDLNHDAGVNVVDLQILANVALGVAVCP
jgi:hypothetical protein